MGQEQFNAIIPIISADVIKVIADKKSISE